ASCFGTVSWTALASRPRKQQRSQLSSAYWTTLRNGGDVTTSETELHGISGDSFAGPVRRRAFSATCSRVWRVAELTSPSSCRVFFRRSFVTSRRGGVWPRRSLIVCWDLTDTAGLGGRE